MAVPVSLIAAVAGVKDQLERTLFPNKIPRFTKGSIHLLNSGKRGSNAKASRELGYTPYPVREALREQVKFFFEKGILKPRARL